MTWKVDIYNRVGEHWIVEHSESQTAFKVKFEGKQPSNAQARLVPLPGKALPWTGAALEEKEKEVQEAFKAKWVKEDRRRRLQELVQTKLGGDTYQAASVLSRTSGRKVSHRSVQAWLVELNRRSSRPCPQWAVDALETYVPSSTSQDTSADRDTWVLQNEVRLADERLLAEESWRKKWEEASDTELRKRSADRDIFLTRYILKLEDQLRVLISTLKTSKSFEDYKTRSIDELERLSAKRFGLHTTAQAIRDGREEFSNPDGLLESGCK